MAAFPPALLESLREKCMRFELVVLTIVSFPLAVAQEKPKNIPVSTWVREDLFAGFLDGDMARHGQGVKKLDDVLAKNPKNAVALAWKGGNALLFAVRAYEAGNIPGFEAEYNNALDIFARAAEIAKQIAPAREGVLAITGGSFTVFGDRLPPKHQREAWLKVRENYSQLRELQKAKFDGLPVHFRGEVMAGLAQAAQRLGETEKATELTQELVTAFPGTPYAVFAKRWLDKPETMAKTKVACASCHDAGRLQAALNATPRN